MGDNKLNVRDHSCHLLAYHPLRTPGIAQVETDRTFRRCVLVLAIGAALLGIALSSAKSVGRPLTLQALWGLGFGSINPQSLVSWHLKSLISLTLIANLPQFTLSILYLAYNGIFTCLVSADEWNRFASQRKALRVTAPRPGQRSVYWLQLPYLYAVVSAPKAP